MPHKRKNNRRPRTTGAIAEAKPRTCCQYEQGQWSNESASQIEISDSSLTGIGNNDYNISAVVKNKSESEVTGLRLSITARDCPTQDAQVADCDITLGGVYSQMQRADGP